MDFHRSLSRAAAAGALAATLLSSGAGAAAPAPERIGPALSRVVAAEPDRPVPMWVHFTDRAGRDRDPAAFAEARLRFTARSLDRRARRGAVSGLEASDLPVHPPYVRALVERGARLRGTSRWLNAASIEAPAGLALELARLPFVRRIERVESGVRREPPPEPYGPRVAPEAASGSVPARALLAPGDPAWYGPAYRQNQMMQVPALHAAGLSGAGVLLCMIDTGYRLTHRALTGVQVVAARDFIHGDTVVDNELGEDLSGSQFHHGTWCLALAAGSRPGQYAGPAYGAQVALAKTEEVSSETPVEMDYWQFAAEWADSLGADVISSSLGYLSFDAPHPSYTQDDLDGRTTVITRAAAEAARRGITVVVANGNAGPNPRTLGAPADADSILSVGAVDSFNVVTSFSSRGPTADGRIKPDVTAMGTRDWIISVADDSSYGRGGGTSFATPLVAGLATLLLEAHPLWRPFEVREALRETALNHAAPNSTIGWGLVQGMSARSWVPSTTGVAGPPAVAVSLAAGPNPLRAGGALAIRFAAPGASRATLDVLDLSGRRVARLHDGEAAAARTLRWSGAGADGRRVAPGVYWVTLRAAGAASRAVRVVVTP